MKRPINPAPTGFPCKRANERGFTLIETALSIVIILIAVIGLFAIFTNSIASRNAPQSFEIAAGIQYLQEGLERVYADRRNPDRGFSYVATSGNYPNETLGNGYARTTVIADWTSVDYKQVTVTVTHNGATVASGVLLVANYPW
jgi:Tfp pilus assembly protein PilV